jgi:hypothetical protein
MPSGKSMSKENPEGVRRRNKDGEMLVRSKRRRAARPQKEVSISHWCNGWMMSGQRNGEVK